LSFRPFLACPCLSRLRSLQLKKITLSCKLGIGAGKVQVVHLGGTPDGIVDQRLE
jgi:hypothetical protein